MAKANRLRRLKRRQAHRRKALERNLERGHTSGDLTRALKKETDEDKAVATAKRRSKVGQEIPAYHRPPQPVDPIDSLPEPPNDVHPDGFDWDAAMVEARAKKRSLKSVCEKRGWSMCGTDPKNRLDWQVN